MKIKNIFTKTYIISMLLIITMSNCMANEQNSEKMDTQKPKFILYLEAVAEQGSAELRINDIPIGIAQSDKGLYSRMVEDYLLPNKNTLSVTSSSDSTVVIARIAAYKEGEFVDGKTGKTFIHTKLEQGKTESMISGDLASDRARWTWLNNKTLTSADKKDALEAAKSIYQHLANADTNILVEKLKPWLSEVGSTYSQTDKKQRADDLKSRVKRLKSTEIWKFSDINSIEIRLIPVANNKLYDLRRADGSPLLRTNQKTSKKWFSIGNMIGKQGDEWKIYR